jgi:isocitrate dehydrogenase
MEQAVTIENALLYTLESGIHTGDFGDKSTPAVNTTDFAAAIIGNLGKLPVHNPRPLLANNYVTPTYFKLSQNPMLETPELVKETIVGVDFFVESNEQPTAVAEKCLHHTQSLFDLTTISNRGTQVWPRGSIFTNLVNQYRCRFESIDEKPLTQADILKLTGDMMQDFKICSYEILNKWGNQKGYSLAQGQ